MPHNLERKINLEEVLPFIWLGPGDERHLTIEGQRVKIDSLRYQTFVVSGTKCVSCGLQASYFRLQKQPKDVTYHLNLYGTFEGAEVLFTKDHIKPLSKGGPDKLENLQTMCSPCNNHKGSHEYDTLKQEDLSKVVEDPEVVAKYMRFKKIITRIQNKLELLRREGKKLLNRGHRSNRIASRVTHLRKRLNRLQKHYLHYKMLTKKTKSASLLMSRQFLIDRKSEVSDGVDEARNARGKAVS